MALKNYNPTTPSRRALVLVDKSEVYKGKPLKKLTKGLSKSGGRNNRGRITVWWRGGGHKRSYRIIDFKRQKDDIDAAVHIYGENDLARIEVYRFFNPKIGSHLFTSDFLERDTIRQSAFFNSEGTGFEAIAAADDSAQDSVPIFRFFNTRRNK